MFLDSMRPAFYAGFFSRRLSQSLRYLLKLLAVYETLRLCGFVARNGSVLQEITVENCVQQVVDVFPENLEIQVRNKRFYYSLPTPIVLPITNCVRDGFGLAVEYAAQHSLQIEDLWSMFAPYIVMVDNDDRLDHLVDYLIEKQKFSKNVMYQGVFVSMGRERALQLESIDISGRLQSVFRWVAEQSTTNKKTQDKVIRIDRNSIRIAGEEVKAFSDQSFPTLPQVSVSFLALVLWLLGFIGGVLGSLDLLVTSTILFVLVRQNWLIASFRFWNVKSHTMLVEKLPRGVTIPDDIYKREQQVVEAGYLQARAAFAGGAGEQPFQDISESFFVGVAIHTATITFFVSLVFPYPVMDVIGLHSVVHILVTVFYLKYFCLPGLLINQFIGRRLIREAERAPVQQQQPTNVVSEVDVHKNSQWVYFVQQQQNIVTLLCNQSISLDTKLMTLCYTMDSIRETIYGGMTNILHVWSRLNRWPNATGGPGWCYGMSVTSGAWVLLCWYDHPCSEMGVNALAAFPGAVYIPECNEATGDVPPMLLPTKREIRMLETKIKQLKESLAKLS
mmetsp:Transcript_4100/g.6046  ORF Transcript_4100/g.6046 Transcript_4100/m.6046 type:complete len:561 (+) Transcript_4100:159-1841(+)